MKPTIKNILLILLLILVAAPSITALVSHYQTYHANRDNPKEIIKFLHFEGGGSAVEHYYVLTKAGELKLFTALFDKYNIDGKVIRISAPYPTGWRDEYFRHSSKTRAEQLRYYRYDRKQAEKMFRKIHILPLPDESPNIAHGDLPDILM